MARVADRDIWFEVRPIHWACDPEVDFSLDALKLYISLLGYGGQQASDAKQDIVIRPYSRDDLARRVFADSDSKTPLPRFLHALEQLKKSGVVKAKGDEFTLLTVRGLPYRLATSDGYPTHKEKMMICSWLRLKAGMFKNKVGAKVSWISILTPEELLLLVILFQGSRWVFGGVHQEYVRIKGNSVVFGTLVNDMWDTATESDVAYGCMAEKRIERVLESLIDKGHFAWATTLLDFARAGLGRKASGQKTVVLKSDSRHPRFSSKEKTVVARTEQLTTRVLIPCFGFPLGKYQPNFVKMLRNKELVFKFDSSNVVAPFGVTRL